MSANLHQCSQSLCRARHGIKLDLLPGVRQVLKDELHYVCWQVFEGTHCFSCGRTCLLGAVCTGATTYEADVCYIMMNGTRWAAIPTNILLKPFKAFS